jgi:hypothetical protein
MAITLVQSAQKVITGVNSTTLAFGSNNTAGNMLAVFQAQFKDATIGTPTDTQTNTYVGIVAEQSAAPTSPAVKQHGFYVKNCAGGANTVTFTHSGTASGTPFFFVVVSEWEDVDTVEPLDDTSTSGPTTSANPTTGDIDPTADGCLLIGAMIQTGAVVTITAAGDWTLLQEVESPAGSSIIYKIQTTETTEDRNWTLGSSKGWIAYGASFKPEVVTRVPVFHVLYRQRRI